MKRTAFASLAILALPALLCAVSLLQFTGEVLDEQSVELRWRVDSVQGMSAFEVERSTDNEHFQVVGERVPANGGLDYSLLDRPGLASAPGGRDRMTDVEQIYYYRLYYVLPSGGRLPANPEALRVSFTLSTVSVTWGSIKAMFR
jgi:hypothetical protein